VSLLATVANLLVSHPSVPANSVQELVRLAKARPGLFSYATSGVGTSPHLAAELFKYMTKTDMVHVPYKGAGPAFLDLVSGRIDLMFPVYSSVLPLVKTNKVKAIAVTSLKRATALPQVPTIDESGLKGFEVTNWFGMLAPAGTPKSAVDRLNAALVSSFNTAETVDTLATRGLDAATSTPEQLLAFMRDEINKWGRVVKAANIKPEY
jgi:tripartite-type tricarboxylate transporter receptor subunit TctC